jgi:hypothetical protein
MSKVMIVLVSDQRMQNIIPVLQERLGSHDLLVPIVSKQRDGSLYTRYVEAYSRTVEALGSRVSAQDPEPETGVDPFVFADTEGLCQTLIRKHRKENREVIVNITSGTKPMSIGAYRAALAEGVRTIYVDTENEQVVSFYPDGRCAPVDFDEHIRGIDVQVYLVAHGKRIDTKQTADRAFSDSEIRTARVLREFEIARVAVFMSNLTSAVGCVASNFKHCRYFDVSLSDVGGDDDLLSKLEACHYVIPLDKTHIRIQKRENWNYLNGRWLEAYVYLALRDSGKYHDVRSGVQFQGVRNDLDVVCVHNARLAILECKAGDPGGQGTLNKLRALK